MAADNIGLSPVNNTGLYHWDSWSQAEDQVETIMFTLLIGKGFKNRHECLFGDGIEKEKGKDRKWDETGKFLNYWSELYSTASSRMHIKVKLIGNTFLKA